MINYEMHEWDDLPDIRNRLKQAEENIELLANKLNELIEEINKLSGDENGKE